MSTVSWRPDGAGSSTPSVGIGIVARGCHGNVEQDRVTALVDVSTRGLALSIMSQPRKLARRAGSAAKAGRGPRRSCARSRPTCRRRGRRARHLAVRPWTWNIGKRANRRANVNVRECLRRKRSRLGRERRRASRWPVLRDKPALVSDSDALGERNNARAARAPAAHDVWHVRHAAAGA